jgi:fibronectin type 3 domain-containing protein
MKKVTFLVVLAAVLPAAAWADCTYPKKPEKAPDGNKATRDEMVTAKKLNVAYQSDMSAYLKCLGEEKDAALAKQTNEDEKKKITARWEKKNDAAVDEAQDVADRFNVQLHAFQAKNAK